jgi:hypothetical protein
MQQICLLDSKLLPEFSTANASPGSFATGNDLMAVTQPDTCTSSFGQSSNQSDYILQRARDGGSRLLRFLGGGIMVDLTL